MTYNIELMSEIRFYHLQNQTLEQALPALLSKAYQGGRRIVVKCADEKQMKALNDHLWAYHPDSFLPHGSAQDEFPERQPIYLTTADENPAQAGVLILTGGCTSPEMGAYELCCEMLDGRNGAQVAEARKRWKAYQDEGHDITYWQQGEQGGWQQKA